MKYVFLAIVSMMSVMTVNAKPSDSLINAIIKVESNDNVNAIGDNGKAVGCMQIWKVVVDDVNKVSKLKYNYNDRFNKEKSIEIFKLYINKYATAKRLGRTPTDEDMARIWNGGPNGFKKAGTKHYWLKVKAEL